MSTQSNELKEIVYLVYTAQGQLWEGRAVGGTLKTGISLEDCLRKVRLLA